MVARVPVPGLLQVRHNWEIGDKIGANVLHYTFTPATPSTLGFVELVAGTAAAEAATQVALWGPDTSYLGCTVTDLSSSTAPSSDFAGEAVGTRAGDPLPANVALLYQYSIGRRYRGGHPRTYWPWFTAADVDTPQTWDGASLTAADAAASLILGAPIAVSSGGFTCNTQVAVSYYLDRVLRVTPVTDVVTPIGCEPMIASQRRRDGRH